MCSLTIECVIAPRPSCGGNNDILKSQWPSTCTIQSPYGEDFRECVPAPTAAPHPSRHQSPCSYPVCRARPVGALGGVQARASVELVMAKGTMATVDVAGKTTRSTVREHILQ